MSDERVDNERRRLLSKPAYSSLGLCDDCCKILANPDENAHEHHLSPKDLPEAAEKRCYICRSLGMKLSEPGFPFPSSKRPETATALRFWCEHTRGLGLIFFCGYMESNRTIILRLEIRDPSDDFSQLATHYPEQSTWSAANIERAKQWLQRHSDNDVVSDFTAFMPKRLLHIQALKDDLYRIKLCEAPAIPQRAQYLTLSHCWGNIDFLRLKKDNIRKFQEEIQYQSLPKTFRDAIKVTYDLNFQYLWIDSLCIIQDLEEDWLSHGAIMGQIYQNALCNIAADAAQDGEGGLFRMRDVETLLPLYVEVDRTILPEWKLDRFCPFRNESRKLDRFYLLENESWEDAVGNAPLGNRAWVLQERLLSRKIIHFTTRQLFFESKDNRYLEDNCSEQCPWGLPSGPFASRETEEDKIVEWWNKVTDTSYAHKRWVFWSHIVATYSQMRLTYDTDRLAALSGIVKEVQSHSGDEYLAGLWKKDLPYQLLWHSMYPQSSPRTQSYTAPTWSWASIGSAISNQFLPVDPDFLCSHHYQLLVEIVEARIASNLGEENMGAIKDGLLRLRGPLRQAWLNQGNHETDQKPFWAIEGSRKEIHFLPDDLCTGQTFETFNFKWWDYLIEPIFESTRREHTEPRSTVTVHAPTQSVFLLPILSASNCAPFRSEDTFVLVGLTLLPTDKCRGQFQRVGIFFMIHEKEDGSILHLRSNIEERYYEEEKDRGRYTISII